MLFNYSAMHYGLSYRKNTQCNALWFFDGTLNPVLNGLYIFMHQSDHYQLFTRPIFGQDQGLVVIQLVHQKI